MARKVTVRRPESSFATFQVKRRQARSMVSTGLAYWSSDWEVTTLPKFHHQARGMRQSNQGEAYELAAIEKHRQIILGGLTNGERQPIKFQFFRAAKVGHQP